jgi:hypothetical protein
MKLMRSSKNGSALFVQENDNQVVISYISEPLGESNVSRRKSLCGRKLQAREFFFQFYICVWNIG